VTFATTGNWASAVFNGSAVTAPVS
jgi:hypothetical protein